MIARVQAMGDALAGAAEAAEASAREASAPDRLALDAAAFAAFHAQTARPLWGYLRAASGSAALADDLLQESFLRLLRAEGLPAGEEDRRRYLFRIATNLLHDHRRAARRFVDPPAGWVAPEAPAPPPAPHAAPPGCDVLGVLKQLAPRERRLLWLAHVEEASHAEIAAATGLAARSVRVLLFRARRKLAALLDPAARRSPR
jgi:RNA polymerase sigma-70 factor (ECF subfamily)